MTVDTVRPAGSAAVGQVTGPAANAGALQWNAVVLAGGRATRLGGVPKPLVEVGGRSLLGTAMAAAQGAQRVVVVGRVPVPEGVLQTVEDPPFGGPAAGLSAGLSALDRRAPWTLVLASDLPVADQAVPLLLDAAAQEPTTDPPVDGICFRDREGHPQWLLAIYRTSALQKAVDAVETSDLSMRRLLAPLALRSLPGDPELIGDCDTWADVFAANAGRLPHLPADPPPESEHG